jgi:hypothetical protein
LEDEQKLFEPVVKPPRLFDMEGRISFFMVCLIRRKEDWRIDGGKIPPNVINGVPGAQSACYSDISIKLQLSSLTVDAYSVL